MTIFKFWWNLSSWKGVDLHGTAKVIRQHMFFYTLSYFLDYNLWNKKMIVLFHENHDEWPNVTPLRHFCSGLDHANRVSSNLTKSQTSHRGSCNSYSSLLIVFKWTLYEFYLCVLRHDFDQSDSVFLTQCSIF